MLKKKTFCFDIDNTICKTPGNNYSRSVPIKKAIKVINLLFDRGHTIKLYTARYMGRNKDNISKAKKQGRKFILNQLEKWNVKYNYLYMGKPSYDLLIDDKSLFFKKNWPNYFLKNFLL
jgi:uncharacterized HAD superfamily protein